MSHVNANTLIGAIILFSGHPYIWATLQQAHNRMLLQVRRTPSTTHGHNIIIIGCHVVDNHYHIHITCSVKNSAKMMGNH